MAEKLKGIESIEKELLNITEEIPSKTFRNINKYQLIQNTSWPLGAYRKLSKIPLGNVLPAHPKLWINNLRIFFGNKTLNKRGYKNLIGYHLLFPFAKKRRYKIYADAIFFKRGGKYVVLFYPKRKSVFKVILSSKEKHRDIYISEFSREIQNQKIANQIQHTTVSTPKLKSYQLEGDLIFFEQELISESRSINYFSKTKIKEILNEVFDFMLEFYKRNSLELRKPEFPNYDRDKIYQVLNSLNIDTDFVEKFFELIHQEKKLIYGRIHGDLHLENILWNKDKIYIIDWGESKETFWIEKFINDSLYFPNKFIHSIFIHLINQFQFNTEKLYTVKEQQFLIVCQQLFERVSNEQLKPNKYLSNYVSAQFKILKGNNLL